MIFLRRSPLTWKGRWGIMALEGAIEFLEEAIKERDNQ